MKKLNTILAAIKKPPTTNNPTVKNICLERQQITEGSLFCAYDGEYEDGRLFLKEAERAGAVSIFYDGKIKQHDLKIPVVFVESLPFYFAPLAKIFYGDPNNFMQLIGVTGTNGKSSTTYFITQCLEKLSQKAGMISTIGFGKPNNLQKNNSTTPDIFLLYSRLKHLRKLGCKYACVEVSSHGIDQARIAGLEFKVAVFTNLSQDHLDYHKTFNNYAKTKAKLFEQQTLQFAVINNDDPHKDLITTSINPSCQVISYGRQKSADLKSTNEEINNLGLKFTLESNTEKISMTSPIIGEFNIGNLLASIVTLKALNYENNAIAKAIKTLTPTPGRMQLITENSLPQVIIDYAHTPDALEKILTTIKKNCHDKIYLVFGCGGDRDKGKRAKMARIAERFADRIIVTTDNPRFEKPASIAHDIIAGLSPNADFIIELDRANAISLAIQQASQKDCVLLAGKGHEDYIAIRDKIIEFDEQKIVREALNAKLKTTQRRDIS